MRKEHQKEEPLEVREVQKRVAVVLNNENISRLNTEKAEEKREEVLKHVDEIKSEIDELLKLKALTKEDVKKVLKEQEFLVSESIVLVAKNKELSSSIDKKASDWASKEEELTNDFKNKVEMYEYKLKKFESEIGTKLKEFEVINNNIDTASKAYEKIDGKLRSAEERVSFYENSTIPTLEANEKRIRDSIAVLNVEKYRIINESNTHIISEDEKIRLINSIETLRKERLALMKENDEIRTSRDAEIKSIEEKIERNDQIEKAIDRKIAQLKTMTNRATVESMINEKVNPQ